MVNSGRIDRPTGTGGAGALTGTRDRRRTTASRFWDDGDDRADRDDRRRRFRGYIRLEGATFDPDAPRGTYVNIIV